MPRIRFVKPELFIHEGLARLSERHRLCFIGLWTLADREGRLEDRPERIRVQLFPYDPEAAQKALDALATGGFHGTTDNKDLKIKEDSGATKGKVKMATTAPRPSITPRCWG